MLDVKCDCGKILCQSDQEFVIIKCRHCKRFIFIKKDDDSTKLAQNPHFAHKSYRHHSKHA